MHHENFVLILQLPQHKPVIIPLGQDSDESDSETVPDAKNSSSNSSASMGGFLGNLDQFLSNVRQDVEQQVRISSGSFTFTDPVSNSNPDSDPITVVGSWAWNLNTTSCCVKSSS